MSEQALIKVENVSKKFSRSLKRSMAYGSLDVMKAFLGFKSYQDKLRKSEFWALDNISFELNQGEALGIVGMNGSGKSTLLRLLTGIFPPDKGKITVRGKIGSLISVGAGFHPHMTGRENIYLNGTILGMQRKEIIEKFESIVDFAEIGQFLDSPVSTYSSGMRVRLGLAIAIHSQAGILLIDEILSVGDISFRNKSLRYMNEFRQKANGLIFVSHDLEQVRNLCDRVIVMDKGKIVYDGETDKGIVFFEEIGRGLRLENLQKEVNKSALGGKITRAVDRQVFDAVEVLDVKVVDSQGHKIKETDINSKLLVEIEFELHNHIPSLSINLPIVKDDFKDVYCINIFSDTKNNFENLNDGKYKVVVKIPDHHLMPGVYHFGTITLRNNRTLETYNKSRFDYPFTIKSDGKTLEKGFINVDHSWEINKI